MSKQANKGNKNATSALVKALQQAVTVKPLEEALIRNESTARVAADEAVSLLTDAGVILADTAATSAAVTPQVMLAAASMLAAGKTAADIVAPFKDGKNWMPEHALPGGIKSFLAPMLTMLKCWAEKKGDFFDADGYLLFSSYTLTQHYKTVNKAKKGAQVSGHDVTDTADGKTGNAGSGLDDRAPATLRENIAAALRAIQGNNELLRQHGDIIMSLAGEVAALRAADKKAAKAVAAAEANGAKPLATPATLTKGTTPARREAAAVPAKRKGRKAVQVSAAA